MTLGPHVSHIFQNEEESDEEEEDSDDKDYDHNKNTFPVPTVGCPVATDAGIGRGWTTTNSEPGERTRHATSPTPPGFVLNVHPNYIPFKLVDDKTG